MAEVWLARATGAKGFSKTIVVKTILPHLAEDPDFLRMFIDEALLASSLNHPNIVQIFDLGEADSHYFIAMEFIKGRSLRQIQRAMLRRRLRMPQWLILRIVAAVCSALDYAHNRSDDDGTPLGLVHRDATPENIMISFSGITKVVDFGIAKATTATVTTQIGRIKGKFAYLAPEQIHSAGKRPADHRIDIYTIGVILYEMLTGVRPFRAESDVALFYNITNVEPTPPREIDPKISEHLSDIVMKALAKKPEQRFQTASELGDLIESILASGKAYPTERHVCAFLAKLFDAAERREPTPEPSPAIDTPSVHALSSRNSAVIEVASYIGSNALYDEELAAGSDEAEVPAPVDEGEPELDEAELDLVAADPALDLVAADPALAAAEPGANVDSAHDDQTPTNPVEATPPGLASDDSSQRSARSQEEPAAEARPPIAALGTDAGSRTPPTQEASLSLDVFWDDGNDEASAIGSDAGGADSGDEVAADAQAPAAAPPREDGAVWLRSPTLDSKPIAWDDVVKNLRETEGERSAPVADAADAVAPDEPSDHPWHQVTRHASSPGIGDSSATGQRGHMWDAFIRSRPSPGIGESEGRQGSSTAETAGEQVRAEPPWRPPQSAEHSEAAAKFDEGLALIRAGQREQALECWEQSVALDPDNRRYQGNLRLLRKTLANDD